jgi:hypothetical protein
MEWMQIPAGQTQTGLMAMGLVQMSFIERRLDKGLIGRLDQDREKFGRSSLDRVR